MTISIFTKEPLTEEQQFITIPEMSVSDLKNHPDKVVLTREYFESLKDNGVTYYKAFMTTLEAFTSIVSKHASLQSEYAKMQKKDAEILLEQTDMFKKNSCARPDLRVVSSQRKIN